MENNGDKIGFYPILSGELWFLRKNCRCFQCEDAGYGIIPCSFAFVRLENGFAIYPKMTRQHVAILLCTYNGEKYIREQVQSIVVQTHADWSLWVSDDDSQDRTLDIIRECMKGQPQALRIFRGPSRGSTQNFMSLLYSDELRADYFAFCDQDDIWYPDKIERALRWHEKVPADRPNLYGARTRCIDEGGNPIGLSTHFIKKPSFPNALVQCIAGGNTMVFNNMARKLACLFKNDASMVAHDWWLYILVSGAGGCVYYDSSPVMDYRQHSANLVGSNIGINAAFSRIRKLMRGEFRQWNEKHLALLEEHAEVLSSDNRAILASFKDARSSNFLRRVHGALRSGIYRQTLLGQIGVMTAICFMRV